MLHIKTIEDGVKIYDALNSDVRLKIIAILKERDNINLKQLASALRLTNGALTTHIKKLEDSKIIKVSSKSGVRGSQKVCSLAETKLIIDFFDENDFLENVYSFDIGIGHYVDYKINPTCGIVTKDAIIGEFDDPKYFTFPERIDASLLWFTTGHVSYQLPNSLKGNEICSEIQICMELCSEAPGYSTHYPSDINFMINNKDLGYFTSPGEFNDRRGIFTPSWWFPNLGQYGKLKLLTVNQNGCYIDGLKISDTTVNDLNIGAEKNILFTIRVDKNAKNVGGVTLFGKNFGDYDNGITLKMFYTVT